MLLFVSTASWQVVRPAPELLIAKRITEVSTQSDNAQTPSTRSSNNIHALPKSGDDSTAGKSEVTLQQLQGSWMQERFGQRTLTIDSAGLAKMLIEPSDVFAFTFGKRIDLEFAWQVKNGRAIYRITGGSPMDKVELAKKSWGDRWDEAIVAFSEKHFELLGEDGTRSVWWRVENAVSNP